MKEYKLIKCNAESVLTFLALIEDIKKKEFREDAFFTENLLENFKSYLEVFLRYLPTYLQLRQYGDANAPLDKYAGGLDRDFKIEATIFTELMELMEIHNAKVEYNNGESKGYKEVMNLFLDTSVLLIKDFSIEESEVVEQFVNAIDKCVTDMKKNSDINIEVTHIKDKNTPVNKVEIKVHNANDEILAALKEAGAEVKPKTFRGP